jgi:hypothetical protein
MLIKKALGWVKKYKLYIYNVVNFVCIKTIKSYLRYGILGVMRLFFAQSISYPNAYKS